MNIVRGQSQVGRSDRTRAVGHRPVLAPLRVLQKLDHKAVRCPNDRRFGIGIIDTCYLMQEIAPISD